MDMSNSSSSSVFLFLCKGTRTDTYIITFFMMLHMLLLLPLSILVLFLGYQQWRKQRSTASHSDILTYNVVAMEMIGVLGVALYLSSRYSDDVAVRVKAILIMFFNMCGVSLFHCLTCVECYLAVVHPITYLSLRQGGGVRIRNISVACVWLLSFACTALGMAANSELIMITFLLNLIIPVIGVSFCSLSVLCVLIRPGPGQVGGNRKRVDHSKQRAFHTIMAITVVLWLRFGMNLVSAVTSFSPVLMSDVKCRLIGVILCLSLPSSLVLPLMFLHRAGKLPGCKGKIKSGQNSK